MRGIVENMKNAEIKQDELVRAAESLEQIANGLEEWIEQQKGRFEHTTAAFRKKWISDWFSDFFIIGLFKDKVHNSRFEDIVDMFRLDMPNIAESLKQPTIRVRPCCSASAISSRHWALLWARGFSTSTCLPACKVAAASSK